MADSSAECLHNFVPDVLNECIALIGEDIDFCSDPVARCLLCKYLKQNFYCVECIRNGDFIHSKKLCCERYADKKLKTYNLNERKADLLKRFENALSKKIKAENMMRDINVYRERIRLYKEYIKLKKKYVIEGKKSIEKLKQSNIQSNSTLVEFSKKVAEMRIAEKKYEMSLESKKRELAAVHSALKTVIHRNTHELVTHIFTITRVDKPKNLQDNLEEGQCAELEEALKTTYVRGQWVMTGDPLDESVYSIVEPCIPGNGDYSAYLTWRSQVVEGLLLSQREDWQAAFGICAALSYTAQLVCALGFFLDVQTPKRLHYSEFCSRDLDRDSFLHKVAKLNCNVVHLCLSQKVNPAHLRPQRTLPNLLLLIDPPEWGPTGPQEELIESIERSLCQDLLPVDDSGSDNSEEADFVHISEEEDVPDSVEMPSQPSFVSSVFSLWRVATGLK